MRGFSSHICSKSLDFIQHHLSSVSGRQVCCDDYPLPSNIRNNIFLPSTEISRNHLPYISNVIDPPFKIFIVHFFKNISIPVDGHLDGPFRIYT
jgi:hypothetical protein